MIKSEILSMSKNEKTTVLGSENNENWYVPYRFTKH